jgi:HEAT repeat protein
MRRCVTVFIAALFVVCCCPDITKAQEKTKKSTNDKLLEVVFNSKDSETRLKALKELEYPLEDNAVEKLCKLLDKDKNPEIRERVAIILGSYPKNNTVFEALKDALTRDLSWKVRGMAAWSFGQLNDKRAIPLLISALKDLGIFGTGDFVSSCAAESLGKLYAVEAVPHLIQLLSKRDKHKELMVSRFSAAVALTKIGDEKVIDPLLDALKNDPEAHIRKVAIQGMANFRPRKKTVDPVIKVLEEDEFKDSLLRTAAIVTLSHLQLDRGIDAICELVRKDKRKEIRLAAAYALGFFDHKHDKRKETLRFLFRDSECDLATQCVAAKSLGELGDKEVLTEIKAKSKDAEGDDKIFLLIAMQLLGEKEGFGELKKYFESEKPESEILKFDLPFCLLRNGYFTENVGWSLWKCSGIIGLRPIFHIMRKLFPEGPEFKSLVKFKDVTEYWKALRKFQRDNLDNLVWNARKKCYLLKKGDANEKDSDEKTKK